MSAPLDSVASRRGFLKGMAGILAAGVAPAAIGSGILMPIRNLWTPPTFEEVLATMPDHYVVGVDNAAYDYTAWVKMENRNGVMHIIDWHPK